MTDKSSICSASDVESVFADLSLANSILHGICVLETPTVIVTNGKCDLI